MKYEQSTNAFSIAGVGSYLPPRRVLNDEVADLVGLDAARIHQLFGIEERRWVRSLDAPRPSPGQSVADLAAYAAAAALEDAGLRPVDIDALVAVSTTVEFISPPLDYRVRRKLGTGDVIGLTLHAACTGIFRAAAILEALFAGGRARVGLIVAADAMSQFFVFDRELPKDLRMSMALYGDGAGAVVVVPPRGEIPRVKGVTVTTTATSECPGIMFSGPLGLRDATLDPSSDSRRIGYHDFRRVLEKGGALTRTAADTVLDRIGKGFGDLQHIITHQATGNLKGVAEGLGFPPDKLHVNIDKVGNTLSPSTLILMDELKRRRMFQANDLALVCSAESATWSYGGMAVTWS